MKYKFLIFYTIAILAASQDTTDITLGSDDNYQIVAAIDFGTTYSGYAISTGLSEESVVIGTWVADDKSRSLSTLKAPTTVLTKPGGNFHTFGFEAEQNYIQLPSDMIRGSDGYNLYRHFKMLLYDEDVRLDSTITSTTGHVTKAFDIFVMSLKYLKDSILARVNIANISSEIHWVIAVPAIWTEESKMFMRMAAVEAGLISSVDAKNLVLALEPEVVSMYSISLQNKEFTSEPGVKGEVMIKTGDKIIVVDAGGGIVDITVHEVLEERQIKEIAAPSGGSWGSTNVDRNFQEFMNKILGADFIMRVKSKFPQHWLQFMHSFEKVKKAVIPQIKDIKLQVPQVFDTEFRSLNGKGIEEAIKEQTDYQVSYSNGVLVIQDQHINKFFSDTIEPIINHIQNILATNKELAGSWYIILVGGFGNSLFFQEAFIKHFASSGVTVLSPDYPEQVVFKGEILFSHSPMHITSRIAKVTYGCNMSCPFVEGKFDPIKKIMDNNGEVQASDCFSILVTKGTEIKTGSFISKSYTNPFHLSSVTIGLFKTERESVDIVHVDEPGVIKLGNIVLGSPNGEPLGENLEVHISFGHTEMLVEARDADHGNDVPVSIILDILF